MAEEEIVESSLPVIEDVNLEEFISVSARGMSDILPQGDGVTAIINKNKPGLTQNIPYIANKNYIDPETGSVYQYQGKGTFKRVYP